MSNIRVLVADDSPTSRALMVGMLSAASGVEVVGQACDGLEALEMTHRLRPNVVTMDIQMPNLDGYGATRRIMTEVPTAIVIVSSLDVRNVKVSMEALQAGALAVISKPEGPGSPLHEQQVRYLAATVRAMSDVRLVRRVFTREASVAPAPAPAPPSLAAAKPRRPKVIAIAASTGGPAALHEIFGELGDDFAVPIVVVQHIASGFGEGFATWLGGCVKLRIKIPRSGDPLRPGTAYIAPDGLHLGVSERSTAVLSEGPTTGSFRPSANVLFESCGRAFGAASVGVILTGMGDDGLIGMRALRAAGGHVIAQDEATSNIFGMPGSVIAAGLADRVLPLYRIADELKRLAGSAVEPGRS